ncbi:Acyl-[acyl-carrier-protein] desaturase 7, chloroplastic [Triticum urartu]|uniref:Acyl-[acyl-carrier-protein] desaturase 7, chloroplastic n=1 Tax=Triticum urartu TaxID=4572 RepID=M8A8U1_TRIUA|nr:Acyl-[acyl-carrier-protein] desaturase 7, chloroplastic [Triticum urartu]
MATSQSSWLLRHACPLAMPWTRTGNNIGLQVTNITYWRCSRANGGRTMAGMTMSTANCLAQPAQLQGEAVQVSKRSTRTGRGAAVAARHEEEGTDDEWLMYLEPAKLESPIHNLIQSGMVMNAARSPYHGFIYVAFQERATSISHGNTARRAKEHGDLSLARICGAIAADEKRHELVYTRIVGKLFEIDPDGAVRALAYMMRRRIVMPASLMTDGRDSDLFSQYGAVAQQAGIYTASDYRSILEHLINQWGVEELVATGLSDEGRRARDYVCALPRKIRRLEQKAHERNDKKARPTASIPFSWIFDRPVNITMA